MTLLGPLLLGALTALGPPRPQESGLQAAVRLVGEQRFSSALDAARADPEPVARAQAELYVLHQGGALEDALLAGLQGLEASPSDPWLLERCAYIALSLGAGELAEELYLSLQDVSDSSTWESYEPWLGEARALEERRRAEEAALQRARLAILGALLAAVVPLCFRARS